MRQSKLVAFAAAFTVASIAGGYAHADDTWNAGSGQYKNPANWQNFTVPGANPGESASFQIPTGGNLNVNIDGAAAPMLNPLLNLRLGSQDDAFVTTLTGTNGATLSASNIISSGSTDGGSNVIGLDFVLPATGNVVYSKDAAQAVGYALTFNGSVTNSANIGRTVQNTIPNADLTAPTAAVTYNNGFVLSTAAPGSTQTLTFRTDANAVTIFNGAISGTSGFNVLISGSGITELNAANTYAGSTTLGANSPNVTGTIRIGTDTPFSTGQVTFTGGSATQYVEAKGGTRTLANNIVLGRYGGVQGTLSQVWNGSVAQSNSRGIVNNMTGAATLTLNGSVFTDTTGNGRTFEFQGDGNTIINGVVAGSQSNTSLVGRLRLSGNGTTTIRSDSTYNGDSFVAGGGRFVVGNGATGGSLVNSTVVSGGTTGTGTFAFDRSDDLTSNQTLNGAVGYRKINTNTVTLATTNFNTGNNVVTSGTLLVNGGSIAQTTQSGVNIVPVTVGTDNNIRQLTNLSSTAGLRVGQSVFIDGNAYAGSYIKSIDSASQVTVYTFGSTLTPVNAGASNQTIVFDAGHGLGGNTTVSGGTFGGNGTLGGGVTVQSGGTLATGNNAIGTLAAAGVAQFNPNSTWNVEYNGSATQKIDRFDATSFTVFGGNLNFVSTGSPLTEAAYVFATYTGPNTFGGTFTTNGVPAGYVVDYNFNGNSFALINPSLIPEPTSLAALVGVGGLLLRRRRA